MSNLYKQILAKKLILISGKGGTGKSLLTASLGYLAAKEGKRVLLIESSAIEQIPPLLGKNPVGHAETRLLDNLYGINIDPRHCFEEYVTEHLGQSKLYEKVFNHRLVKSFLNTIPGLAETMLLGRIFHSSELTTPPYDLILFDGPASGHFQNILTTPQAVLDTGLGGPLVHEVNRVYHLLTDQKKSAILLATLGESLVLSETLEFLPKIQADTKMKVLGIILNRAFFARDQESIENWPKELSSCEPLKHYFANKLHQALQIYAFLRQELKQSDLMEDQIWGVPEFGTIDEPLAENVCRSIWQHDLKFPEPRDDNG